MKRLSILMVVAFSAVLASCGGEQEIHPSVREALTSAATGGAPCMPAEQYIAAKRAGAFKPRPAQLPDGAFWVDPWLLVPATLTAPGEAAPGLVGTPVVVEGPDGLPKHVTGLFYVEGQTPGWVCQPIN